MDIKLECSNANISATSKYKVVVELDNFDIVEIVDHFGTEEILDYIDVDFVKSYFGLTEIE